jgi:hypothetical protein
MGWSTIFNLGRSLDQVAEVILGSLVMEQHHCPLNTAIQIILEHRGFVNDS